MSNWDYVSKDCLRRRFNGSLDVAAHAGRTKLLTPEEETQLKR
jgi:hypothetical protein